MNEKFSPIKAELEYTKNGFVKTQEIKWTNKKGDVNNISNGVTYKIDRKTGQIIISKTFLSQSQKVICFKRYYN